MNTFDQYVNETLNMLNERSINKINKEFSEVVIKMAEKAKEYSAAEGDAKANILAELKELTAKKKALTNEMDDVVAGKDRNVELAIKESEVTEAYGKPAGLSKDETMEVAQKFADAMSKADGTNVTVNKETLEEDSFDLDVDGEEFDGGSYNIYQNGNVMNMAIRSNPVYGKKNDSVDTIAKNIKKMSESVVTEGVYAKQSKVAPGEYIMTQYGYFYKRVEGKVGGQDAYVEIKNGKEGKRKTSIHDTVDFDIVDKKVVFESSVTEGKGFKNTEDFEAFLEEIDGMPESAIKKIMGKDYIDTPGFYQDEKDDYEDIIDFMISNMGNKEFEKLQDWWESNVAESVVNEGKKVTLKRRYTENYPAVTAGKAARIRNKVLEAIKDGKISQEEFDKLVSELSNNSKRWTKNNAQYFTISEEGISLSKFGQKILKSITVNEKTEKNPEIWVPGGFDKELSKIPNQKIDMTVVSKLARKYQVDLDDAIKYVEYGWMIDLNENNTNNMKTKFIYESFSEFVNSLNESTETLNEAFASTKLASILTGANKMDKDLPKAFYQMSKIALDKIQDIDIIEMDPATAKKEKRANAVYLYFTTNEKENPYAGSESYGVSKIPGNTLLAITDGSNEWMSTEWQRSYSRDKKGTTVLKTTKRDYSAGFAKSGSRARYGSGISSMKQVAELADRAYCLDLDILRARYSTTAQRDERAAAKKGAIAFKNDKDFKQENLNRYNTIIANRAAAMPIDKMVADAIDTLSSQIKDALTKGEKTQYNEILLGKSSRGREAKLQDAANHMQRILDDFQRYVSYTNQAEEEKKSGYGGDYYAREVKNYAKSITDRIKQIETFGYAW